VRSGPGDDVLLLGDGDDDASGGAGRDSVDGGRGQDVCHPDLERRRGCDRAA
jgi:Ca2+-binding RTX toxin-like protein